jgi:hypothetical protein
MTTNNTTFTLQFCPYPQGLSNCTNITSFNPGASFVANVNFTFPMKGTFSGGFQIVDSTGTAIESAGNDTSGLSFKSALLPAATITGGIGQTTGNSPGSGTAVVNGTTPHITLSGAFPNHTFTVALCDLFGQCNALAVLPRTHKVMRVQMLRPCRRRALPFFASVMPTASSS